MVMLSAALLMEKARALNTGSTPNNIHVTTPQNGRVYTLDEDKKRKPCFGPLKRKNGAQQVALSDCSNAPVTATLPIFSAPSSVEYNVAAFKPKNRDEKVDLFRSMSHTTIERRNIFADGPDVAGTKNTKPPIKGRRRVKTWRVYPEKDISPKARAERYPWVIDAAGRQRWAGQLDGGNDGGHWAVLIRRGNYFEFTPLNRIYHFRPMDQVVESPSDGKQPSAAGVSNVPAKMRFKLPDNPETLSFSRKFGSGRAPHSDDFSEFSGDGDIDELDYARDASDDEEIYRHDGLAEDTDERELQERMKRAHLLDTDGGQDRAKEPSEGQAAQRQELRKSLKAIAKYFDPRTEMDDPDESEDGDESEDDEYMVKYRQVDLEDEPSPTQWLMGVQPQKNVGKRPTSPTTPDMTCLSSPTVQTPKKSPSKSRCVGNTKEGLERVLDARVESDLLPPGSGASSVARIEVPQGKPVHTHERPHHNRVHGASSLVTGGPMPTKSSSQAPHISVFSTHGKATKRKEETLADEPVSSIRKASSLDLLCSTVDLNPSPNKKKRTNNRPRPPCPTTDELITLLRANGGAMSVDAVRRCYQTRKYTDSREIVSQFVRNSQFVTTSKPAPKNIWVHLKPQYMLP
ncbi:hypothetical protein FRC04_000124 [Tulasnella sp. 424]|nr:hypothetical protein FRC04_000124 [Tulasnella sp. 424]KAG8981987.1 hypothetical protein FRC05_000129 [Tulasnella sp. 425]